MAKVGMKYCVCAPITSEQHGQPITYGTGVVMGKAISADISYQRASNALYADDAKVESDNSITGGTVNFTVDQVTLEGRRVAFGLVIKEEEGGKSYDITGRSTPYIGQGYIEVLNYNGKYQYRAIWLHKVQYGPQGRSSATKGEQITWQTEAVTGDMLGAYIDDSGEAHFERVFEAETEAAAMAWLKKQANIA